MLYLLLCQSSCRNYFIDRVCLYHMMTRRSTPTFTQGNMCKVIFCSLFSYNDNINANVIQVMQLKMKHNLFRSVFLFSYCSYGKTKKKE